MKVLVFEYNVSPTGHRTPYARLVAAAVNSIAEATPIVCFPEVLASTKTVESYFPGDDGIEFRYYPLEPAASGIEHCRHAADSFVQQVKEIDPDYILLPTADGIATVLGIQSWVRPRRSLPPLDILLMRFEHLNPSVPRLRRLKKWLQWKITKRGPWNRIMQLDPLAWSSCSEQVELCPDPVPNLGTSSKLQAREKLGLPADIPIVASVGNQNEIKGVDLLLRAFSHSNHSDYALLLAGPMSKSVKRLCDEISEKGSHADRLIVWDRLLSETEFQDSMLSADVIAVPYRRTERPSGVVCRAISWNRPLIGSNHGWTNWACNTLSAGLAVDTSNTLEFSQGIRQALDFANTYKKSELAAEFSAFNTQENFNRVWTRGILKQMGKPADEIEISAQLLNSFKIL